MRYAPLWPTIYWGLTGFGALYVIASLVGLTGIGGCGGQIVVCDAAAYYYADGYAPTFTPQFGYSPAFSIAFAPFRLLPFDAFVAVWFGLHVAALLWLRAGFMLAIPGVNEDVIRGNVGVFIALAVVLALHHFRPAQHPRLHRPQRSGSVPSHTYAVAWMFPLLTKVLPGVGVVWHAARREWGDLGIALGSTLTVVVVGALIAPHLWIEWVELLSGRGTDRAGTLLPRIVLAAVVIAYAARTDRAWLVPFAIVLGSSGITPPSLMKLAAVPRLRTPSRN